jgi:hypothetical protein
MDNTNTHALENSWWPSEKCNQKTLPQTSRCIITPNQDNKQATFQIEEKICTLPIKWRVIFVLIDLCQLHALSSVLKGLKGQANISSKLVVWFDRLRLYIVMEAIKDSGSSRSDWIPPVVHRFCVRVESGIGHQPRTIEKRKDLEEMYKSKTTWSYGMSPTIVYNKCYSSLYRFLYMENKER